MAAIKINGYNDKKSKRDSDNLIVVFTLTDAPGKEWTDILQEGRSENRSSNLQSLVVQGKELIVHAPDSLNAQQILEEVNAYVQKANGANADFEQQLKALKFD